MRSALGSITELERGKRYRVRIEGSPDPVTGKRRQYSRTVRGSRKDAERARTAMLANVGALDTTRPMTLGEFWATLYLPHVTKRLRASTVAGYTKDYACLVEPYLASEQMSRITPLAVERWLGSLKETRRLQAYKLARQMFSKAVKWSVVDKSPMLAVDVPQHEPYKPVTLTAEQAQAYLAHFRGHRIEVAVLLALGGGFRRSEIAALDWEDVSEDGAVSIHHAITMVNGAPVDDAPKSQWSRRVVHLPRGVTERLNELRTHGACVQDAHGRISPNAITKAYEQHLFTLDGVPRIPFKDLRHTSLTLALESGADILTVSRRAGHSTIAITSAYYLRPHEHVDVAAAAGLDGLLSVSQNVTKLEQDAQGCKS